MNDEIVCDLEKGPISTVSFAAGVGETFQQLATCRRCGYRWRRDAPGVGAEWSDWERLGGPGSPCEPGSAVPANSSSTDVPST